MDEITITEIDLARSKMKTVLLELPKIAARIERDLSDEEGWKSAMNGPMQGQIEFHVSTLGACIEYLNDAKWILEA